jgi:hypothetical protein
MRSELYNIAGMINIACFRRVQIYAIEVMKQWNQLHRQEKWQKINVR